MLINGCSMCRCSTDCSNRQTAEAGRGRARVRRYSTAVILSISNISLIPFSRFPCFSLSSQYTRAFTRNSRRFLYFSISGIDPSKENAFVSNAISVKMFDEIITTNYREIIYSGISHFFASARDPTLRYTYA